MSNEALAKMVDNIVNKDYNKANKDFDGAISDKLQAVLDQAKIKIAGQIFNGPEVAVAPDEELVAGEVTNSDLEAEQAADEVEAEIDAADEIELDDEEYGSEDEEDESEGDFEETPEGDNQ